MRKKEKKNRRKNEVTRWCADEAAGFKHSHVPTRDLMRSERLARLRKSDLRLSAHCTKTVNCRGFFVDT